MSEFPSSENLTDEQSEALEKAALLIIRAKREGAAMLARAGVSLPEDGSWFGNPCFAQFEGHGLCPCNDYEGDGEPCRTLVTIDTAFPPVRSCGHPPSKHLPT